MFVFDVSDTIPLHGAPELPQSVTNPFAIFRGKEKGELAKTIQNAKRDGIRVHESEFGSQYAGRIQTANTSEVFRLPVGSPSSGEHVAVRVRYELLLNSRQIQEERYATLVHELGHLYCGHLGPRNAQHWPDRRYLGQQVEECEAESVSYLACERIGIESPSAEYIAQYLVGSGKMPPISVDTVLKAAGMLYQMGRIKMPLRKPAKED